MIRTYGNCAELHNQANTYNLRIIALMSNVFIKNYMTMWHNISDIVAYFATSRNGYTFRTTCHEPQRTAT